MKIVTLLGSPRPKGNSTAIAKHFCETAEKLGAEIETFSLNKLKFRGCQACMTCKTKLEKCVLKDDLSLVLEAVESGAKDFIVKPFKEEKVLEVVNRVTGSAG